MLGGPDAHVQQEDSKMLTAIRLFMRTPCGEEFNGF